MDFVDLCTRERANTKWKFYKLTNLTVFAALLKDVPMGCKDSVLPEPLLINKIVICLTFGKDTRKPYNDSLCLFEQLLCVYFATRDWKRKHTKFSFFSGTIVGKDPSKFQGVHVTDFPKLEEMLQPIIFLYDIDLVDEELIGELAQ